jgi:hypothetical protein
VPDSCILHFILCLSSHCTTTITKLPSFRTRTFLFALVHFTRICAPPPSSFMNSLTWNYLPSFPSCHSRMFTPASLFVHLLFTPSISLSLTLCFPPKIEKKGGEAQGQAGRFEEREMKFRKHLPHRIQKEEPSQLPRSQCGKTGRSQCFPNQHGGD